MGANLHEEFTAARQTFAEANEVLGFDLQKICFNGGLVELNRMTNLFPALLTFSVAAFRVYLEEIGIIPDFFAGHSLGEYSALVCSGVMNFSDALKIVHKRGLFAQEAIDNRTGAMTIINGVDEKVVERECRNVSNSEQIAVVSCYNAPGQVAISGHLQAVMKVEDELMKRKAQVTPLLMSPPFHCPLMQQAADKLKSQLTKYSYHPAKRVVIANVTARPYSVPQGVVDNLTNQLIRPVKWKDTMDYLQKQGVEQFIEMGPQAVLTNLVKTGAKTNHFKVASFGQKDDRNALLQLFHTRGILFEPVSIDTHTAQLVLTQCLAAAVCTRNLNWDQHQYQRGVVEPYEKIEKIQDQLDQNDGVPTMEQMEQALEMLRSVMKTKKVPIVEQVKRFNKIFHETGTRHLFRHFNMPSIKIKN